MKNLAMINLLLKTMRKYFIISVILLSCITTLSSQNMLHLTLDDALGMARQQSLQAFLNQHYYMADYWAYRSYRANLLPSVYLRANPLTYTNASILRYNSLTQTDEFIRSEYLASDMNIGISQNLTLTGGTFFVQSALDRIENFGANSFTQYSSVPFRIGYRQELFGFNPMKWQQKIEPLKFEKAKKEYLEATEEMNISTVRHFFAMARAAIQKEIASANMENIRNLLQIAQNRFDLGTVTREELLDLRLSQNNAAIALQEAMLQYREARESLLNFLMLPVDLQIEIELPQNISVGEVDLQLVLENAIANNPEILQTEQLILENQRNVEQAKAARHFSADVNLAYGISKDDGYLLRSGRLDNVYSGDFNNHQRFSIGITIPILDWGRSKGHYEMAVSQQQIAEIAARQTLHQFEQNAVTSGVAFNIQKSRVESAALSDTLASESYELTMTRFRGGGVNVLQLTSSQAAKDRARLQYISALTEYWISYFSLRRLTLYDFENNRKLEFNHEELLR
jgi:outer membrane protein TolC